MFARNLFMSNNQRSSNLIAIRFAALVLVAGVFFMLSPGGTRAQSRAVDKSGTRMIEKKNSPIAVERASSPFASLLTEEFNYSVGQLTTVSSGNWVNFSGTAQFIQVSAGNLTYTGYASSGVGNKIDVVRVTTSAEDAYRQFATQSSGTIYAGFLLSVTNTTGLALNSSGTGDYMAGFLSSSSTTALNDRIVIKAGVTANTYQLGLRASTSNPAAVFSTTEYTPGVTHLIVFSYQIVAGAANDIENMWIDPALGGSEPAATVAQTSLSDLSDVARFFIRQNDNTPNASIDGIRVGTAWRDITGATTAADVSVSGRVTTGEGRGILGSRVVISSNSLLQPLVTTTGARGYYSFQNLRAGETYVVTINSRKYTFSSPSRVISLVDNVSDADFVADPFR